MPIIPKFKLPDGYDFIDPHVVTAAIADQSLYGGADISQEEDARGVLYTAMCARKISTNKFGFRVFYLDGAVWRENAETQPFCSGRGEIGVRMASGKMGWVAWEGNAFFYGDVAGAAPFVPQGRVPTPIPADGAIDVLYQGVYVPADLDTPAEVALRVQKQLDAIQELGELLKQARVLI